MLVAIGGLLWLAGCGATALFWGACRMNARVQAEAGAALVRAGGREE